MAQVDFKKVKRTGQRDKDIVYGYIKQMQLMFPEDNTYFTIVQLIQDLCLLYFCKVINSKILTDNEGIKLMEMVDNHRNTKYNNGEWKLLFRATRDGFKRCNFFDKCDKMDNTICIIQTPQNNVFGGFTSLKWEQSIQSNIYGHGVDPLAFVYTIRSNGELKAQIFPICGSVGSDAIQYYRHGYLSFGNYGSAFYIHDRKVYVSTYYCTQYHLKTWQLNGDRIIVLPTEIEVFQIPDIAS